jgi:hypothetical protein
MPEYEFEDMIAGAVDDYRTATLRNIRPAGPDAAHKTARHRKRVHTAALAGLIAVFVAVPVAAYAVTDHDHNGPPTTAASSGPTPPPSASVTQATPSSTPSTPSTPTHTTTKSTPSSLNNVKLTVPSWGGFDSMCPHGTVQLHNGIFTKGTGTGDTPQSYGVGKVVTTDVNHDGSTDIVALLECERSDPGIQQVAAYHRSANGTVALIGQVVLALPGTSNSTINAIHGLAANANGTIRLQVGNLQGSSGIGVTGEVLQWRTYGWDGHGFHQVSGSRSFQVSDGLTATASNATFTNGSGSTLTGTMTVTIHNSTSHSVNGVSVAYAGGDADMLLAMPSCTRPDVHGTSICAIGTVKAGHTVTLTLHLTLASDGVSYIRAHPTYGFQEALVQVRVGDQALSHQPTLGKVVFK